MADFRRSPQAEADAEAIHKDSNAAQAGSAQIPISIKS